MTGRASTSRVAVKATLEQAVGEAFAAGWDCRVRRDPNTATDWAKAKRAEIVKRAMNRQKVRRDG